MVVMPSRSLSRWWTGRAEERYWLESTDREDLGADLRAPAADDGGHDNWRYSLIRECAPGDVVFHYHKHEKAIIARSGVAAVADYAEIVWGARGTYARAKGTKPHLRAGWKVLLEGFSLLKSPLTIETLRSEGARITSILETLTERHGRPLYYPFEVSKKRPVRLLQGYAFKLPAAFVKTFLSAEELPPAVDRIAGSRHMAGVIGREYRTANPVSGRRTSVYEVDPDAVDRGLLGHAATQNALADAVRGAGGMPLSPKSADPPFDVAWLVGDTLWIAEVKSITTSNEETQLRLGLGQLLRYAHQVRHRYPSLRLVLAVEHEPTDPAWREICESCSVTLVGPSSFRSLVPSASEPGSAAHQ